MAALTGAVFLSGCQIMGDPGSLPFLEAALETANPAASTASLANGAIIVSGPDGYCVDTRTLRSTASGGFAAIASCNILTDGESGPIVEPVLVTVTVKNTTGAVPSPQDIASALETELLDNRELSAVTAGQLAKGGETAFQNSDPRHWRGVFEIGNHLVGVTLYAPKGSPFVGAQGAAFLNTVSSRIRANSATPNRSAEQTQPEIDTQEG